MRQGEPGLQAQLDQDDGDGDNEVDGEDGDGDCEVDIMILISLLLRGDAGQQGGLAEGDSCFVSRCKVSSCS